MKSANDLVSGAMYEIVNPKSFYLICYDSEILGSKIGVFFKRKIEAEAPFKNQMFLFVGPDPWWGYYSFYSEDSIVLLKSNAVRHLREIKSK